MLLVLGGAARSWWSDNTNTLAAAKVNPFALVEAVENHKDDRRSSSSSLSSFLTSPHISLIASPFISQAFRRISPIRDDSKIYKLNSSFLI
jgi:hypothetical protein